MGATLRGPLWNERTTDTSDDFTTRITLPFLVECSKDNEGMLTALSCPDLPNYGDTYAAIVGGLETESDALLLVKSRRVSQHDNHRRLWRVDIGYDSAALNPLRQAVDPRDRLPPIKRGRERFKEGLEVDLVGNAIVNSAGVPFSAIETDASVRVLEIHRNLPDADENFFDDFEDLVNTEPVTIDDGYGSGTPYDVGRVKVHEITQEGEAFENNIRFFPTRLVLHIKPLKDDRPNPWRLRLLNQGEEYFDAAAGVLRRVPEANGRGTRPQLLDDDGGLIPRNPVTGAFLADPTYSTFIIYPEGSYASLKALFSF